MKITIGGLSGTGTSTIGRELAKRLAYEFASGGNFARKLAMENGMTMEERDKYLLENNITTDDEKIDGMQKEFGNARDNFVLESRLGWFNVPNTIKIKLYCEDAVRFERTSKSDSERFGSIVEDFEKTKKKSLEREEVHRARIEKTYGIKNLNDDTHFDLIVDTTNIGVEKVLEKCLEFIESRK